MSDSQQASISDFHGTWIYAQDPEGVATFDGLFEGATITLSADGSYAFALGGGGSMGPMKGSWTQDKLEGDSLTYTVDYGEGRVAAGMVLKLRRQGGEIVGVEHHEDTEAPQYYTRQAD